MFRYGVFVPLATMATIFSEIIAGEVGTSLTAVDRKRIASKLHATIDFHQDAFAAADLVRI
jgi:hypothetical protein